MDNYENKREIINSAQLPRFAGRLVSICGYITDTNSSGKSFTLRSSDNELVTINLRTPINRPLEGYVEVHGISQGKSVLAEDYICFNNETFDVRAYNNLCNYLYSVPNLWKLHN